jgi:hypothetical protein
MNNISFSISANQNASQPSVACPSGRLTQHKRFVPYGTHPNSAFGGTSFMLRTLAVHCRQRTRENNLTK